MDWGVALVILLLVATAVSIGLGIASTRELHRALPYLKEGKTRREASRAVKSPSERWPVDEYFEPEGLEAARRGVRLARWQMWALLAAAAVLAAAILI